MNATTIWNWFTLNKTHIVTVAYAVTMGLAQYYFHADPSTLGVISVIGASLGISAVKSDHTQTMNQAKKK